MRPITLVLVSVALFSVIVMPAPSRAGVCPDPVGGWGVPGTGPGQFSLPDALVRDPTGRWLVTDEANNRVQIFDPVGGYLGEFGSLGSGAGQLFHPVGIAIGPDQLVYVSEHQNHRISVFTLSGAFVRFIGSPGSGAGRLFFPVALDINADGHLFVANSGNDRVDELRPDGSLVRSFGAGLLSTPYGVRVAPDGTVWVTEYLGVYVRRFAPSGTLLDSWSGSGDFLGPEAVTFDASGNVYVVDTGNDRVQVFDPALNFVCTFGSTGTGEANLDVPTDAEFDSFGRIVIADYANNRIRIWGFTPTAALRSTWGSLKLRYR